MKDHQYFFNIFLFILMTFTSCSSFKQRGRGSASELLKIRKNISDAKILVIDKKPDVRQGIVNVLIKKGFSEQNIITKDNGYDALKTILKNEVQNLNMESLITVVELDISWIVEELGKSYKKLAKEDNDIGMFLEKKAWEIKENTIKQLLLEVTDFKNLEEIDLVILGQDFFYDRKEERNFIAKLHYHFRPKGVEDFADILNLVSIEFTKKQNMMLKKEITESSYRVPKKDIKNSGSLKFAMILSLLFNKVPRPIVFLYTHDIDEIFKLISKKKEQVGIETITDPVLLLQKYKTKSEEEKLLEINEKKVFSNIDRVYAKSYQDIFAAIEELFH